MAQAPGDSLLDPDLGLEAVVASKCRKRALKQKAGGATRPALGAGDLLEAAQVTADIDENVGKLRANGV